MALSRCGQASGWRSAVQSPGPVSFAPATVALHLKWRSEHGISGVFRPRWAYSKHVQAI